MSLSQWRTLGDVSYDTWRDVITNAGGPAGLASEASYAAARPHSALILAMAGRECHWGTTKNLNKLSNRNVLNLKQPLQPDGSRKPGFMAFTTWDAGIREAHERITSTTYGNGIYVPTKSVFDLISVFAPASENDVQGYVDFVEDHIQAWETIPNQSPGGPTVPTTPTRPKVIFGRVKKPAMTLAHVKKPYDGAGFTRLSSPRKIVGACDHRTLGLGDAWVTYRVFSGERLLDTLTDYVVDLDGLILELNDPFGTRAPWANGGSDGLEGDGPAFARTLGIDAINSRLVSIENVGVENTPYNGPQFEASCQLQAWIFDQAKVRFDDYPFNPNVGCVTDIEHWEMATKACPFAEMRAAVNRRQNRVRAILKAAQLDTTVPDEVEPEKPVENPAHELPDGYSLAGLEKAFGSLKRYHDKDITQHSFNIDGPVSNAWIARGLKEKRAMSKLPPASTWTTIRLNGVDFHTILFDGAGNRNWILVKRNVGSATWEWAL